MPILLNRISAQASTASKKVFTFDRKRNILYWANSDRTTVTAARHRGASIVDMWTSDLSISGGYYIESLHWGEHTESLYVTLSTASSVIRSYDIGLSQIKSANNHSTSTNTIGFAEHKNGKCYHSYLSGTRWFIKANWAPSFTDLTTANSTYHATTDSESCRTTTIFPFVFADRLFVATGTINAFYEIPPFTASVSPAPVLGSYDAVSVTSYNANPPVLAFNEHTNEIYRFIGSSVYSYIHVYVYQLGCPTVKRYDKIPVSAAGPFIAGACFTDNWLYIKTNTDLVVCSVTSEKKTYAMGVQYSSGSSNI